MSAVRRTLPLALYATATACLAPFIPGALRARAARGKEDAGRLGERLGHTGVARPAGPLVWLHGVSVGESLSLLPLVDALQAGRPDLALLVTSATLTSAEILKQRLPAGVIHQFAPVDSPGAVRRFLQHWRPDAGLFVESELWPNLISEAARRGVKLALLSARMTEASARGWSRAPATAKALLDAFGLIAPQDEASRQRLERLGARIGPRLNLKLAGAAPPADPAAVAALQAAIGGRPVIVAASTHPGEDALIARAVASAGIAPAPLLVLVPRHPERGPSIAAELAELRFTVARRAVGEAITPAVNAYVADTLGELGLLLRVADVVVMGGGFVHGIGGHNSLEAARLGLPIVTGPLVHNARDVYAEMFDLVAAIEVSDAAQLAAALSGLFDSPLIARRIGEAALSYVESQAQVSDRALAALEPLLPA